MRVIAGLARGLTLKGPPDAGTRATADKVRGAIFNVLAPYMEGARALDLYAGTGALGIEALSRGALHCDFVERRHALVEIIRENLRRARFEDRGRPICGAVHQVLSTLTEVYDLILLDPPYDDPDGPLWTRSPVIQRLLAPDGIVVLEHSPRVAVGEDAGTLRFVRTRRYGDCAVSFWQQRVEGGDV
jgi:16S rRNA (guanine(966)-N(2))-methyltransferase RsmD